MTHQVHGFVLRAVANVKWYQLVVLGLVLGAVIQGAPVGGGGGTG
jgi:hypothetical protein